MWQWNTYNDIRESIPEPVFKNAVKNPLMSDTEKLSHFMKLKHREALNFIEEAWHKRQSSIKYVWFCYMKILSNVYIIYADMIHKRSILNISVCIMFMILLCFCLLCNA